MTKSEKKIPVDKARELAEEYREEGAKKLQIARNHLKNFEYVEAIQAAQASCEKSMKAIYGFLGKQYTMKHELVEEEYKEVLKYIPEGLVFSDYGRLFEISQVWARWRTSFNYGNQKLGVSARMIFREHEAKLAIQHAEECRMGALFLWQWWQRQNNS